jgi:hypothetical protein
MQAMPDGAPDDWCSMKADCELALCCNLCNIRLDIDPQKHGVLNL